MKSSSGTYLALSILAVLLPFLPVCSSRAQDITLTGAEIDGHVHSSPKQGTVSAAALRVPEKAKRLLYEAQNELRKGREDKAKKDINSALRIAPNYADALTVRGIVELAEDHPSDALRDFNRATVADRDAGLAYLGAGCALNQLYRFDEALPYLDRGSKFFPTSWQAAFELSRVQLAKHEYASALREVNRASSLMPSASGSQGIHFVRGYSLLGLNRYREALLEFEAFLASPQPEPEVATAIRETMAEMGAEPTRDTVPRQGTTGADFTGVRPASF